MSRLLAAEGARSIVAAGCMLQAVLFVIMQGRPAYVAMGLEVCWVCLLVCSSAALCLAGVPVHWPHIMPLQVSPMVVAALLLTTRSAHRCRRQVACTVAHTPQKKK